MIVWFMVFCYGEKWSKNIGTIFLLNIITQEVLRIACLQIMLCIDCFPVVMRNCEGKKG